MCEQRPRCKYHCEPSERGRGCLKDIEIYEECQKDQFCHFAPGRPEDCLAVTFLGVRPEAIALLARMILVANGKVVEGSECLVDAEELRAWARGNL